MPPNPKARRAHWIMALCRNIRRGCDCQGPTFARLHSTMYSVTFTGRARSLRYMMQVHCSSFCSNSMPSNCGWLLMIRAQPSTPTTGTIAPLSGKA